MAAAFACASSAAACSVLLDWNEFSDGTAQPDDGSGSGSSSGSAAESSSGTDGGLDSSPVSVPLVSCGTDKLCTPPVPPVPGWSGPFVLFSGTPAAVPDTCDPAGYASKPAFSGWQGLNAPQAQCSCACGAPQGVTCAPPGVTFYSGQAGATLACGAACGTAATLPLDGGCVAIPSQCSTFGIGSSAPTGGACAPDASVNVPQVAWSTAAIACSPTASPQGSCGSGELCLAASAPFCIMHPGASRCPPGEYYVAQHVYYDGVEDSRGCSACSCAAPSSGSCSFSSAGSVGLPLLDAAAGLPGAAFVDQACTTIDGFFSVPQSCAGIPTSGPAKSLKLNAAPTLDPGACTPSAASPTGDAGGTMATTFCCTN